MPSNLERNVIQAQSAMTSDVRRWSALPLGFSINAEMFAERRSVQGRCCSSAEPAQNSRDTGLKRNRFYNYSNSCGWYQKIHFDALTNIKDLSLCPRKLVLHMVEAPEFQNSSEGYRRFVK